MALTAAQSKVLASSTTAAQSAAKAIGGSFTQGRGFTTGSSSSSSRDTLPTGVAYQTYNSDGSVNKSYSSSELKSYNANQISSGRDTPVGVGGTITGASIQQASPIALPTPATPSALGAQTMTGMAGLGAAAPAETTGAAPGTDAYSKNALTERLKALVSPPSQKDIYKNVAQEAQLQEKQQLKNNYQAQLNAIVAKSQADKLSLVGQGRGVTEAIIGGQQAQIDREAAIQSLPIAAQLTAAQGDLEAAQAHVDTYFKLLSQDAQNQYEYKNKVADMVYNYATDQQKLALDARNRLDDRNFTLTQNNLNFVQGLATSAFANGQSSLGVNLMKLDPNSSTYQKDASALAGSLRVVKKGDGMTDGQRTRSENDDIAQVIVDFQTKIAGGWAGANPDAYSHYKTQLINTHGWGAALKLDKDMAELGITVDRVNIK